MASTDPKDSEEYRHQVDLVAQKNAGLEDAIAALEQAGEDILAIEGDLPEREAALVAYDSELEVTATKLDRRAAKLERVRKGMLAALRAVQRREKAVGIVEKQIARNTISGDGTYRVGTDMQPGTYRSMRNGAGCYFAVNADANGSQILNNGFTYGPALVSVAAGQFFETSNCDDWVLQR